MQVLFNLQVGWEDVIGEPEGIDTPECTWICSYYCFRGTKSCCYLLLTVLFAPIFAFIAAINLACISFQVGGQCLGYSASFKKAIIGKRRTHFSLALTNRQGQNAVIVNIHSLRKEAMTTSNFPNQNN